MTTDPHPSDSYFSRLGEHWENNHKTHVWIVTGVILGVVRSRPSCICTSPPPPPS